MTQSTKVQCTKCNDTGWVYWTDENGYEMGAICSCGIRERQILDGKLKFASIPESFKDVSVESFSTAYYLGQREKAEKAIKAVRTWLENFQDMKEQGKGLYLYSTIKGSGKTRCVCGIANDIIRKHTILVKFSTSLQILQEIRSTWEKGGESELIRDLINTPVLIIDDFGTEKVRDWVTEKFYQIINERYLAKALTIFTSNMCIKDLDYDERIISRVKEMCFEIPFPEESVREHISENAARKFNIASGL